MATNLTPKQEKFAQLIVEGKTGVEAYKTAYDTNAKDNTVRKEANKLMKRDDITARVEELRKPVINHAQNRAINEDKKKRDLIWERVQSCIIKEDDASIARYIDILNKMDHVYVNTNVNVEESKPLQNLDTETLHKIIKLA